VKTRVLLLCLAMLGNSATAFSIAIDSTGQAQATANADEKAEVALPDQGIAIRVNVNLVQMRVVVRDSTGKPVEGLRREDFQLYDRGKLQSITAFEVETQESRRTKREALAKAQTVEGLSAGGGKFSFPDRFVALVIDDTHLSIQDAVHVKMLTGPFLEAVAQTDRVGVFSTSGQLTQDFTNDTDVVKRVLSGISPRPLVSNVRATGSRFECPHVTYGMAEQIENNHDAQAMYGVVIETLQCAFRGDKEKLPYAQSMAQTAVHQVLSRRSGKRNDLSLSGSCPAPFGDDARGAHHGPGFTRVSTCQTCPRRCGDGGASESGRHCDQHAGCARVVRSQGWRGYVEYGCTT